MVRARYARPYQGVDEVVVKDEEEMHTHLRYVVDVLMQDSDPVPGRITVSGRLKDDL